MRRGADGLTARARRAALLLAAGARQVEAAEAVGVNPRTVRTWAARPEFGAAVEAAQADAAAEHRRVLSALTGAALDRLREVIRSGSDGAAVTAIRDVLDRTLGRPADRVAVSAAALPEPEPIRMWLVNPDGSRREIP